MKRLQIATSLLLGLAQPVFAQGETDQAQAGPNWLVNCSNQLDPEILSCSMSQSVVIAATGARILTAVIEPGEADMFWLTLVLPFGLDLTSGVAVAVNGDAWQAFAVNTCDADACYVRATIPNSDLASLGVGGELNISLRNIQGETVDMVLNLNGFAAALSMLAR